jgi:hypothetical protein
MVKNAVRIINLTVFKINDAKLNEEILSDLPYCLSFVNVACLLRDKVVRGIDRSYAAQRQDKEGQSGDSGFVFIDSNPKDSQNNIKFDKMLDNIEDVEDILEYVQEIFEIENETTRRLMCNALMHYFYSPIIIGTLTSTLPEIAPSTALFILNKTFSMIKFQPLINSITIALLSKEGPPRIVAPDFSIQVDKLFINLLESPKSFSHTWKYTLPSQYKEVAVLLTQFYN